MSNKKIHILFVCLGNICRSPSAEGVFRHYVEQQGYTDKVMIDSAGTSDWHVGSPPDSRSIAAAATRGYDLSPLRGRQAVKQDFDHFDYIFAMDTQNLRDLSAIMPANFKGHLGLFLSFADSSQDEVPDPYSGGQQGFETVLDLIEDASANFLRHLQDTYW